MAIWLAIFMGALLRPSLSDASLTLEAFRDRIVIPVLMEGQRYKPGLIRLDQKNQTLELKAAHDEAPLHRYLLHDLPFFPDELHKTSTNNDHLSFSTYTDLKYESKLIDIVRSSLRGDPWLHPLMRPPHDTTSSELTRYQTRAVDALQALENKRDLNHGLRVGALFPAGLEESKTIAHYVNWLKAKVITYDPQKQPIIIFMDDINVETTTSDADPKTQLKLQNDHILNLNDLGPSHQFTTSQRNPFFILKEMIVTTRQSLYGFLDQFQDWLGSDQRRPFIFAFRNRSAGAEALIQFESIIKTLNKNQRRFDTTVVSLSTEEQNLKPSLKSLVDTDTQTHLIGLFLGSKPLSPEVIINDSTKLFDLQRMAATSGGYLCPLDKIHSRSFFGTLHAAKQIDKVHPLLSAMDDFVSHFEKITNQENSDFTARVLIHVQDKESAAIVANRLAQRFQTTNTEIRSDINHSHARSGLQATPAWFNAPGNRDDKPHRIFISWRFDRSLDLSSTNTIVFASPKIGVNENQRAVARQILNQASMLWPQKLSYQVFDYVGAAESLNLSDSAGGDKGSLYRAGKEPLNQTEAATNSRALANFSLEFRDQIYPILKEWARRKKINLNKSYALKEVIVSIAKILASSQQDLGYIENLKWRAHDIGSFRNGSIPVASKLIDGFGHLARVREEGFEPDDVNSIESWLRNSLAGVKEPMTSSVAKGASFHTGVWPQLLKIGKYLNFGIHENFGLKKLILMLGKRARLNAEDMERIEKLSWHSHDGTNAQQGRGEAVTRIMNALTLMALHRNLPFDIQVPGQSESFFKALYPEAIDFEAIDRELFKSRIKRPVLEIARRANIKYSVAGGIEAVVDYISNRAGIEPDQRAAALNLPWTSSDGRNLSHPTTGASVRLITALDIIARNAIQVKFPQNSNIELIITFLESLAPPCSKFLEPPQNDTP